MHKICIIGLGLLGGSIGKECLEKKLSKKVIGFGRNHDSLKKALQLQLVHEISDDFNNIHDADLVIIATPVKQIKLVLKQIKPFLSKSTLITDVGSTKTNIINSVKNILGAESKNFIGSHPIAGSEKNGPEAAQNNLFNKKNIIITPHKLNTESSIKKIEDFWKQLNGNTIIMSPENHDEIFSTVSHLPHALAISFMSMINKKENREELLNFAASGFRDFTRIAASSPEMWRDIFIDNKEACLKDLKSYIEQLKEFENALEDETALFDFIHNGSDLRKNWDE